MAANTTVADPWADVPIKPTPIDKSGVNDADPGRRRATFRVPYPRLELVIDKSPDWRKKRLPARLETTKQRFRAKCSLAFPRSQDPF
jgi:hypothetical protein